MIIWINGAFGSGKTQTAVELNRRIENSFIFDPENAGEYISQNVPTGMLKNDFQDYPLWREINYAMLKHIDSEYNGTIIVPMTIVEAAYFRELTGRLQNEEITVHHFTLCASRKTLLKRLRSRGEREDSWAAQQIDRCLSGLQQALFQRHLDTEALSVEEVSEAVLSSLGWPQST
ncbi:AAA family ATPase [Paenibacillus pedocola]|uniref:AAA family ATPase n=1 Tax=Paenibacillus pedocola TaxID=3242193 RepID=UPI002877FD8D|nr:AAA family ATPase [Paenibacillus typhae]